LLQKKTATQEKGSAQQLRKEKQKIAAALLRMVLSPSFSVLDRLIDQDALQ
jgi:hypothetical protein